MGSRLQAPPSLEPRFWPKVQKTTGCWIWTANKTRRGYGLVGVASGRSMSAHRASWTLAYGPIPDGLCVLHRCDNPSCVRPDHLFLGSNADNIADREAKGRTASGERNGNARLSRDAIAEIRSADRTYESYARLAERFGVHLSTIARVAQGAAWAHI